MNAHFGPFTGELAAGGHRNWTFPKSEVQHAPVEFPFPSQGTPPGAT
ncbi:MAG: hypothetical protein WBV82_30500 [Myxococcaceae bacterium]